MNRVSVGMTKNEIINAIGEPDSAKGAANGQEVLEYMLTATDNDAVLSRKQPYWVVLVDGKCVQYGRAGDFGSALPNTHKLIIEQH